MRVFIREYCRDVIIRIYGINGEEKTREFFQLYIVGTNTVGVYETTDEEHELFRSEAEYTISTASAYQMFVEQIKSIQAAIDAISDALDDREAVEVLAEHTFENVCYVV